ncbi:aldo/keto reductase [Xaviernesmea oryzae]|uniref:Aldo/keto reductase n=1 Tax=Xaviernesmea oryzae TaxID=464029 RepID=A0A1Q9AT51_9HYPH|nr:aldo/keto reductase [Xaviernesmea oryzae]OLP58549.1 aldo/keto reductase [Xaviernesmea oryzae]SEK61523.1 Predicted oxidoreductase [Xaviernesmea oryzae]
MKTHRLGRTDLVVSEICLGTMTWGTQNTPDEAFRQMDAALERGVNFFDTAELYPTTPPGPETYGDTESIIGDWLATRRRDEIVLATKVAGPGRDYIRGGAPITPASIDAALEASLKRLKTDYVDLYQLHWPNRKHYHFRHAWTYDPFADDKADRAREEMEESLTALDRHVKAGRIRAIGLSNDTVWGTQTMLTLAETKGLPRVATVQNEYNLLYRAFDLDFAELSRHENVGLLAYSPLASGLLTGKYLDGARPEGSRLAINGDLGGRYTPRQEPAVKAYVALARAHGLDPAAMALAFCLTRPFMASVIIGVTTMAHLAVALDSADLNLSDEVMAGIAAIHRDYPMPI